MRLIILCLFFVACSRSPEAELIHLLKNNYANIEVNEIHKRKVISRLEKLLSNAPLNKNTENEVVLLLNEMSDGHIKLDHYSWPTVTFESGLSIDIAKAEVLECQTCKPAIKKGRYPLSMIDEQVIATWLKDHSWKVAASSSQGRRYRLLDSLQQSAMPFTKTIHANGKKHELTWVVRDHFSDCVSGERIEPTLFRIVVRNLWCTEGKKLSRREMVFNFKTKWDQAIAGIKADDHIQLDLRNNSGGGDEEVMHVLQTFFSKPVEVFHYQYLAQTQPGIWKKFFQTFPIKRWDRDKIDSLTTPLKPLGLANPLTVLIGPGCFSSCEVVASVLKHEKRAKLMGDTTHGGVGEPRNYPLGQGYSLLLPICRLWQKNGQLYEGVGVTAK